MRHAFLKCTIALAMSACTTLPSLEQNPSFQLGDIVTNISCELAQAAQGVQFVRGGEGWTATMDLSATLQNTGSVDANAGLDIPLTPGTASPNVKLGATGSAARVMTIGYEMDISKPESIPCNENSIGERAQLTSNLGLAEWLLAVQRTIDEQRSLQASFAPNKVATTITFTVTHSGSATLGFSLVPIGAKTLGASFGPTASRESTSQVIIALAEKAPKKKPTEVIIVGDRTRPVKGKKHKTFAPASKRNAVPEQNNVNGDNLILQEILRQRLRTQ